MNDKRGKEYKRMSDGTLQSRERNVSCGDWRMIEGCYYCCKGVKRVLFGLLLPKITWVKGT